MDDAKSSQSSTKLDAVCRAIIVLICLAGGIASLYQVINLWQFFWPAFGWSTLTIVFFGLAALIGFKLE